MKYIIISLKHSDGGTPVFWRANNAGYTTSPFSVGLYTEDQVKSDPDYYNDGFNAIAIPLTDSAMEAIGFASSFDTELLIKFYKANRKSLAAPKENTDKGYQDFYNSEPANNLPRFQNPPPPPPLKPNSESLINHP